VHLNHPNDPLSVSNGGRKFRTSDWLMEKGSSRGSERRISIIGTMSQTMSTGLKSPSETPGDGIVPVIIVREVSGDLISPGDDCDVEGGSLTAAGPPSSQQPSRTSLISRKLRTVYQKIPILKRFAPFVVLPISILVLVNLGVWSIVGIVLRYHPYPRPRFCTLIS